MFIDSQAKQSRLKYMYIFEYRNIGALKYKCTTEHSNPVIYSMQLS